MHHAQNASALAHPVKSLENELPERDPHCRADYTAQHEASEMRECGSDEAADSAMHDAESNAAKRLARMKVSLARTGCGPARILICIVLTQWCNFTK
jgi:hypothetical protein